MAGRAADKVGRRDFIGTGIAVAAGLKSMSTPEAHVGQTPIASESAPVDQNPIRRRGTGLRGFDAARASAGSTLFTPLEGDGTVYLIDLRGNVVHTWKMPYPPNNYGYLTDRGTLFYNGERGAGQGGAALEADWNGKVRWEVRHPDHHHDGRLLKNGNVLLLCGTQLPDEIAKKVRGGRAGTEENGKIEGDYLVEMTRDGRRVWEWRAWEHLDPVTDVITAVQDTRALWTWANAVVELPDGNVMVSFRNISTIIKIDRQTHQIVWKLGAPPLAGQHAPTPLPNGNLLIFDNGPHRLDETLPFSRVIEIDPSTREIVWSYQERIAEHFYSPRLSNAQRLPNGNTLICEGSFGRLFEVTSQGELVWEYVNPYFGPTNAPQSAQSNEVFRAYRYSEDEIARARKAV